MLVLVEMTLMGLGLTAEALSKASMRHRGSLYGWPDGRFAPELWRALIDRAERQGMPHHVIYDQNTDSLSTPEEGGYLFTIYELFFPSS